MMNARKMDDERTQNRRRTHAKQTMNTLKTDTEQHKTELLNTILNTTQWNASERKHNGIQMQRNTNALEWKRNEMQMQWNGKATERYANACSKQRQ